MKPYKKPLLVTSLCIAVLILIAQAPTKASAANNPLFTTIVQVKEIIENALSPLEKSINGLTTQVNNLKLTVTPMPGEIVNLQTTQASQASQINNLQSSTGKTLKVFDKNGQELGLLNYHNGVENTVYSTALKRFMYFDDNGFTNRTAALYQSTNCTGTPYNPELGVGYDMIANDLLPFSPQIYYIFNNSETPTTITSGSQGSWNYSTNQLDCSPDVRVNIQAYQLFPVSLPFSIPLAMPLQFKYQ